MPLTVVTNSMKVAMELANHDKVTVISIGGTLLPISLSFVGPQAENALDSYYVNKAFISCTGVHLDRGLSDSNEMQALVKKKMIEIAEEVYLLVNHTKFDVKAFSRIASIEAIDYLITDSDTKQEQTDMFQDSSFKIIRSKHHLSN